MGAQRGGLKLRRTAKKKSKYKEQFFRTAGNKARQMKKREKRRAEWKAKAGCGSVPLPD